MLSPLNLSDLRTAMRILARLLLICLLALGVYFPARLLTRAQQSGTVNVRPRIASTQPGMPEVKATVNRNRVPVGEEVIFTLAPARILTDPRYRVTLFFGDGKRQLMRQARASHVYPQSGTYTYSILVEAEKQPTPTPTPFPDVKLTATPTSVEVNRVVSFSAQLSRRYPNLRYRFVFGDGADTGWQDSSSATHAYRSAKSYRAYVDIGVQSGGSIKQAGGSQRETVKVTESRSADVKVTLSANPTSVEAGKPVTFNARTTPQSANVTYRFAYGDQTPMGAWQARAQATHRYKSAGQYLARVEVRSSDRNAPSSPAADSLTIEVTGKPDAKGAVDLNVSPGSALVGLPVFFQAVPSSAPAGARYRFNFGDGSSPTGWSSEPVQTHLYTAAGRYSAFVEMAASGDEPIKPAAVSDKQSVRIAAIGFTPVNDNRNDNTNANSNSSPGANGNANSNGNANVAGNQNANGNANVNANANRNTNSNTTGNRNGSGTSLSASPSASPLTPPGGATETSDWWKYVVIAAIILFAAYQAYSYFFAPRPTFVPHVDPGESSVGADNPLSINLQMDVDPNVNGGEFKIDTEGDSLIKSKRIEP